MKAIQMHGPAGRVSLSLAEVPQPIPDEGQVLIKVQAAGVIATELAWYATTHRENGEARHHAIPGHEFFGTIVSLGEGVTDFAPGDQVYGMNNWFWEGATADYCLAVPSGIAPKPQSLSHVEAATVPISALTAWQGLFSRAALQPGERILVQGGGGAVGLFVVKLAHRHGALVVRMSRNPSDFADYEEPEFDGWPDDPQVAIATGDLAQWFDQNGGVFYGRRLEVNFERKHFHWIAPDHTRGAERVGHCKASFSPRCARPQGVS